MLRVRVITTLVWIPLVVSILFLLPYIAFRFFTVILCILASWEWGQLLQLQSTYQKNSLACLCSTLVISIFFRIILLWWILTLLLVCYPNSANIWRNSLSIKVIFCLLILVPFFVGLIFLRHHNYQNNHYTGAWWLLFVMFVVWGADSGAYIVGNFFCNYQLAPNIYPGKTFEGLLGGIVLSMIIAWIYGIFVPLGISSITLVIYAITVTLSSIVGDITESMFKREVGIKDTGKIFPGHGGILDRIDSLTAAIPVFTFLLVSHTI